MSLTGSSNDWIKKIEESSPFPKHYLHYNREIINSLEKSRTLSARARSKFFDPSDIVDSKIALDLADRVGHLLNLPVEERLRELLLIHTKEQSAILLAEEVALGKFGKFSKEESLDRAVRAGLAIVTEGVTVASIQGISAVKIKNNPDGTEYVAVYFAGPIRAAGGTEAALTLVIADHARKSLGLGKYRPGAVGDDEVGRMIEELRVYEREVGSFQFKVSDEDVEHTLLHLPVEIDGVQTDPTEVVTHRGLKRINTDKVRGGALRVLNDGVIGRSRKLLKIVQELSISEWNWLNDIKSGKKQNKETHSNLQDVIAGRPVLSSPNGIGGLRIRYGRSYNTGLSAIGIHPALTTVLDYPLVAGTQVKIDMPGKAATIGFVDTIEPPIVKLRDQSIIKLKNTDHAKELKNQITEILYLGDVLVSYGDFLENNSKLVPSPYVEEWWALELQDIIENSNKSIKELANSVKINEELFKMFSTNPFETYPEISDAFRISETFKIPLHPRYLFYWDLLQISEIKLLRNNLEIKSPNGDKSYISTNFNPQIKKILEKLGVPHKIENDKLTMYGEDAFSITKTLNLPMKILPKTDWKNSLDLLSNISGVQISKKSSVTMSMRTGRPEKAMPRKMKPPVHTLFPIGSKGGIRRDILKASNSPQLDIELVNMICSKCGSQSTSKRCNKCDGFSSIVLVCPNCNKKIERDTCPYCKAIGISHTKISYPLKEAIDNAVKNVGYRPKPPLKGVEGLTNNTRIPEMLEKGILRNKYDLSIYKDGTIRFDATNSPLTHFTAEQIGLKVEELQNLGYTLDIKGKPLETTNQLVELFIQDIILPYECGEHLLRIANFIDDLLINVYNEKPYYKSNSINDMLGKLVLGLAPHTSVGVIGRIIGFNKAQVCFAHPYWHSAKRRDCDGDGDAILLLMDAFLNFSKDFLPAQMGGLMDTPLLIQPIVLPKEVQRQAHNFDVANNYPLSFYLESKNEISPSELKSKIDVVRSRLKKESQFYGLSFTHPTSTFLIEKSRSTYSTVKTLSEKLEKQIDIAIKICSVDVDKVVSSVLNTHLLPDILGNMTAYTSQKFRCRDCGRSYRRMPVRGTCLSCGKKLQTTVSRKSVEKYLKLSLNLCERFNVDNYINKRLNLISNELKMLFPPTEESNQVVLTDYV